MTIRYLDEEPAQRKIRYLDEAPPPEARGARPESFMEDSSGRRVEAGRPPASFMEDSSGRRAIFNPGATGRDRVRVEEPGAMPGEPPEWPGRVEQGAPPGAVWRGLSGPPPTGL